MKHLSVNFQRLAITIISLIIGYAIGSIKSKVDYVSNVNELLNINQLEKISLLNQLQSKEYQAAISSLESSLSGGFVGRTTPYGGMQSFRELNSNNSGGIKDLNNVVLGVNEYFCTHSQGKLDSVLKKALESELKTMGRENELCRIGR